ncbi:MAG: type II toxin-antitoxin system RelE/ParE family toxin [Candidatus Hydrogenedentes bacterium]|nr:type II toxin-antitoxin system RelE/ParE family toxin [Candidatus Hydrogenedentota bacterium]
MIVSFRDRMTRRVFHRERVREIDQCVQHIAQRKLVMLHAAEALDELKSPPGNRLEKLSGNRQGQYSIRITDQWRICFRWQNGAAHDVQITDYH